MRNHLWSDSSFSFTRFYGMHYCDIQGGSEIAGYLRDCGDCLFCRGVSEDQGWKIGKRTDNKKEQLVLREMVSVRTNCF